MIPKIIHYCWFGKGEKPKFVEKCIRSWKKHCPDYQIIEWNEDNFDVSSNRYAYEAYQNKKYAFVTDYVRLHAMVVYGGIYMDTDVELLKPLDQLLSQQAFSGFELPNYITTGIMACEKKFELFEELLKYYEDARFIDDDGKMNMTTNVEIVTNIVSKYGLKKGGTYQVINGFALYPIDYFSPLDNATGKLNITENTYAIHWFSKSWVDKRTKARLKITRVFHRIFGINCFSWIKGKGNVNGSNHKIN